MKEMSQQELLSEIKWDNRGLVPAVVQDASTKAVLMMAYMNEDALRQSFEKGETVFWSRSREELWHKGATSGNTQRILSLQLDCDGDTLLIEVEPNGPACHTGKTTCFNAGVMVSEGVRGNRFSILESLEKTIAERERLMPEGAYTTYLFEKGVDKILKKVGEEAGEVIIAAKNRSAEELRYEASDLIFHLMVLLQEQKLPLDEVLGELERRHQPK
jgi:phosphoribosyl-ATP pyrophosphohydrolase/phosphoribosyl-AMP cyclohydrolase